MGNDRAFASHRATAASQSDPSVPSIAGIANAKEFWAMRRSINHHLMTGLIHRQSGRDPKPSGFCFAEIPDWQLRQWADLAESTAQAIEAGTAKTEGLGPKDESAVHAPKTPQEETGRD